MKQKLLKLLVTYLIFSSILFAQSKNIIKYETNSFIKDWLILGPFPNCDSCSSIDYHHDERCKGFFTDYLESIGGEKNAIPYNGMKVKYIKKNIERTWTKIRSKKNKIHLTDLNPKDMVVAYAFCQIESPKNQKSILSVGSNDGIKVFFNGKQVLENHEYNGRWLQTDDDFIPVVLQKGINNLLLKIDQGTGDFGFIARFLDYDSVVTEIKSNLEKYSKLKAVTIEDTLVVTFGSSYKISVLNPDKKVKIALFHNKEGKKAEQIVAPGENAKFVLTNIEDGFLNIKATFPTKSNSTIISELQHYNGKLKKHPLVKRVTKDLTILDAGGKQFFPIGTYGAPVEDYKVLKEVGYNFVVASAKDLDDVYKAGLLAAVPIHGKSANDYYEQITKYKDHPAVLCWMLYDEPGYNKADLLYIYDIYNAAYKADDVHPSYLVITTPTVYKTFGRCCDVLAVDTYPITNGVIENVGKNIALAYEQLENKTPIWHCGQMFTWPEQRRPNPQEHRFMTYYSLIKGAKGLLWYTYKGYGQYLPTDDPELWGAQKILLSEINNLAPLFLEKGFGKNVKQLKANKAIEGIIKKSSVGTFLIAVNSSKTETYKSKFILNNKLNSKVIVYNEDRTIRVNEGILKDEFKPLDVHIYKLK